MREIKEVQNIEEVLEMEKSAIKDATLQSIASTLGRIELISHQGLLGKYQTYELVEELRKREGVITHRAEPFANKKLDIEGPALVLIVID